MKLSLRIQTRIGHRRLHYAEAEWYNADFTLHNSPINDLLLYHGLVAWIDCLAGVVRLLLLQTSHASYQNLCH